jgi:Zn-finger nucleic acid-binding protein
MLCPVDGTSVLVMSERQGIEIDYCPTCRGVWLDRGELDKIIERATPDVVDPVPGSGSHQPQSAPPGSFAPEMRSYPAQAGGSKPPKGAHGYEQPRKKKKSGFLSELFEM